MPRAQVDVQAMMRVSLKGCGRLVASAAGNGYKYCFQIINIRKSSNYLHFKGMRTLLIAIITSSLEFISAMLPGIWFLFFQAWQILPFQF